MGRAPGLGGPCDSLSLAVVEVVGAKHMLDLLAFGHDRRAMECC